MILEFIVRNMVSMLKTIFGVLPNVPATPAIIVTSGNWATDQVVQVVSLLRMVYSTPLFNALLVVAVGIISFESVYHLIMWIIRKIPMLSIK